jgi:fumarate hydratase class II
MAQSSNDSFPSTINIAAGVNVKQRLIPAVTKLRDAIAAKSQEWDNIVKIGRTHMQDATPLTLGQEWSGYAGMLSDDLERIEAALQGVYRLALGGTAVGTGINSAPGFAEAAAAEIAKLTDLPFVTAPNKFTVQGAHDALVQLSGTMRTLAVSLYKIANDIRLMSCGPRAGFAEIPENEPGSSIMPGKVNPTQCEALTMISVQVMANDVAVGFGGAGGYLEMNVYKPLMIFNITHSITILSDGCVNFRKFLVEGTKPNLKKINEYVDRSLMLVTALSPVIGYDKASKIAHYAMDNDLTLKEAALKLGFVSEDEFNRVVDPAKMVKPYSQRRVAALKAGRDKAAEALDYARKSSATPIEIDPIAIDRFTRLMREQLVSGDVAARKAYLASVVDAIIVSEDKIRSFGSNDNIRSTFGPEGQPQPRVRKSVQEWCPGAESNCLLSD